MTDRVRLFLIAPERPDFRFSEQLSEALVATEVAAVLLGPAAIEGEAGAERVRMVQAAGAAAIVADDTRIAGRLKADGVQIGSGSGDLRIAAESLRPHRIVGAGNLASRDTAMAAGEIGVDYLFFGKPYGDSHDEPHPKAQDLAAWWSELMEIPCVLMAGRTVESVPIAAASGAEFVAVHHFVWAHPLGPGQAMREAAEALGTSRQAA